MFCLARAPTFAEDLFFLLGALSFYGLAQILVKDNGYTAVSQTPRDDQGGRFQSVENSMVKRVQSNDSKITVFLTLMFI